MRELNFKYSLINFTPADPRCIPISYSLTNSNGSPHDATIFNILDPTSGYLDIYTNDISKEGVYNLKIYGKVYAYTSSFFNL